MNTSGDAAEQIVRMSLEGTEVALRLTGSAAKNIAAALYTILQNKDKNKIRGRQRLTAMLKSGKELKVFTVSEEHLKQFAQEAKRYGVVYCALRGKDKSADGMVDVMVRAEDAAKINRIVERFKLATVDAASIRQEIIQSRAEKNAAVAPPEQAPAISDADRLVEEMLTAPIRKEEPASPNPTAAKMEKSPPSEPIFEKPGRSAEGAADIAEKRPSVRKELREIQAGRRNKADRAPVREPETASKAPKTQTTTHKQPKPKKKHRPKAR